MRFAKAHGTGNDFVVLPDPDGRIDLTPALVAALCDRRRGIGGDGVLRVVRAARHRDAADMAGDAEWFMDYRNSDGSLAQMCGNGVRAYARYLVVSGLVPAGVSTLPIATRAGVVLVEIGAELITVAMAAPVIGARSRASLGGVVYNGTSVRVGNPNLVCWVDDPSALDLARAPGLDVDLFPEQANVEFIAPVASASPSTSVTSAAGASGDAVLDDADVHMTMRVFERGSGETLSCGSGACAAAAVALRDAGRPSGVVAIDVPGGRLSVRLDQDGCHLTGPAVVVATGDVDLASLSRTEWTGGR